MQLLNDWFSRKGNVGPGICSVISHESIWRWF